MSNAAKSYEPAADPAIERAAAGERIVVRRAGAELVAVVPLEGLRRLEELEAGEDRVDVEAIQQFDADVVAGRAELMPFEQVLSELGVEVRHLDYDQGSPATRRRYQRLAIGYGIEFDELGDRLKLCAMPNVFLDDKDPSDELARASDGASLVIIDAFRGAIPASKENPGLHRRALGTRSAQPPCAR